MHLPLAALIVTLAQPVASERGCLDAVAARQVARDEKLIDIGEAARIVRPRGEVVSANLCRLNERLVYVLAVLSPEGRVARIAVDARSKAVEEYR